MKRTGFKFKPRKPLKRSAFKHRAVVRRIKRTTTKGLEAWIRAIPESQVHGSGTLQKRLWRLTSDYVRIRDWYKFGGRCIATGKYIGHWSEGQAGHFKAYSVCRGIFKFDTRNIHLQSASSNVWNNSDTWFDYAEEIKLRWNLTKMDIDAKNAATDLKSLRKQDIIIQMHTILSAMEELPEQPDYYPRTAALLNAKIG